MVALVVQREGNLIFKMIYLQNRFYFILYYFSVKYKRDDKVPLIVNKVPAWLPPSAIKRDALTTNSDFDDEEIFRKVRG